MINAAGHLVACEMDGRIVEIDLHDLHPNPDQPRKTFSEKSLIELAASIERHGLIQPITVKRLDEGTYLLVAGERRFRAFERLGRSTIPAIVTTGDAEDEKNIFGIDTDEVLFRMLATAFGRNIGHSAFQDFQKSLLNAFTGNVACDRRVAAFACNFINFVNIDNAAFCRLDVIVGSLQETHEHIFNVFADIAGFSQRRGIGYRKRYVQKFG